MSSPPLPSSPHTLLQRLDQLDKRLKEIEEKQRVFRKSYISAFSESSCHYQLPNPVTTELLDQQKFQSLGGSSAKDEKGSLMDRLIILETRIVKLNNELSRRSITSSSSKDLQVVQWVQPGESGKHLDDAALPSQQLPKAADKQLEGEERSQRGLHQPSGQKCCNKLQVKGSKESIHAGEEKSRCWHKNNRWLRSRWFAIGC